MAIDFQIVLADTYKTQFTSKVNKIRSFIVANPGSTLAEIAADPTVAEPETTIDTITQMMEGMGTVRRVTGLRTGSEITVVWHAADFADLVDSKTVPAITWAEDNNGGLMSDMMQPAPDGIDVPYEIASALIRGLKESATAYPVRVIS